MRIDSARGWSRIRRSLPREEEQVPVPTPHQVLDAELLFLQSLLEGISLAEISARVHEHEPPPLRFEVAAIKTCPRGGIFREQETVV